MAPTARAWAQSPTAPDPDDPESQSAKAWAEAAQLFADRVDLGALDQAVEATGLDRSATNADRLQASDFDLAMMRDSASSVDFWIAELERAVIK